MNTNILPTTSNSGNRLREFDALRGVSMILVVFAHVLRGFNSTNCIVGEIFMTFRMPLFFFVSGFFAYRSYNLWNKKLYTRVFTQKIKAQVICTICFFALYNITKGMDPLDWMKNGFQGYWFTIVLFQMFSIYAICSVIAHFTHKNIASFLMVLFALTTLIMIPLGVIKGQQVFEILGTSNLLYYSQWFAFGLLVKQYENKFTRIISNNYAKALFIIGFIGSLCIVRNCNMFPAMVISLCSLICAYFGLLFFTSLFYNAKDYFNKSNYISASLCFVGRRTLDIYMLHYFLLPSIPAFGTWLMPNSMALFQLLVGISFAIVITGICLGLSYCIRISPFLANWLFGVRPKYTHEHALQ